MHPNSDLTKLFLGTIEATEEAFVNALVAAKTMTRADGLRLPELPEDRLRQIMQEHATDKKIPPGRCGCPDFSTTREMWVS